MKIQGAKAIEYKTITHLLDSVLRADSQLLSISIEAAPYMETYIQRGYGVTMIELAEAGMQLQTLQFEQFKAEYFDVVLCMDVLEHLDTEGARNNCIKECLKVLKDKGILVISYKNKWSILPFEVGQWREEEVESYMSQLEGEVYPTPESMEYMIDTNQCRLLHHVGLDGIAPLIGEDLEKLTEKAYASYMAYHLKVCGEKTMLGMSHKNLMLMRKEEHFILCENFNKMHMITHLTQWKNLITHRLEMKWGAGEPLFEFANKWLGEEGRQLKAELQQKRGYHSLSFGMASPEYETLVEELGRSYIHRLALRGYGDDQELFISIDLRGDEPFSHHTTKEQYKEARGKILIGQKNYMEERMTFLSSYLCGNKNKLQMLDLRYELAEALVATVIEAERKACKEALFIVEEIKKEPLNSMKQARNLQDINSMIHFIDKQGTKLTLGEITGPLYVSGSRIPLYIGYL
ncbi:MAG: class I SAM-dependent methyltransferase [Cellulosilyticaceae bacterium]